MNCILSSAIVGGYVDPVNDIILNFVSTTQFSTAV